MKNQAWRRLEVDPAASIAAGTLRRTPSTVLSLGTGIIVAMSCRVCGQGVVMATRIVIEM